jgi:hypothetical protein
MVYDDYSEAEMNDRRARWGAAGLVAVAALVRRVTSRAEPSSEPSPGLKAAAALAAFVLRTGQTNEFSALEESACFREVAGDLVADLAHLARILGHDFTEVIEAGRRHFEEECAYEELEAEEEAEEEAEAKRQADAETAVTAEIRGAMRGGADVA